jgi:hypothetical protein
MPEVQKYAEHDPRSQPPSAKKKSASVPTKVIEGYGGQRRNRTADASLFRAALYQLSYLAIFGSFPGRKPSL